MAVSHSPTFVQTPKVTSTTIVVGSTTTKITAATAGSDGSKVVGVIVTTDDAARDVRLWLAKSTTSYLLGTVPVPSSSGFTSTAPAVNLLNSTNIPGVPTDNDGQRYIFLESGDSLQVQVTATVTTLQTIYATTIFGNF